MNLPDLPSDLTVVDMLSDYMEYLYDTAKVFLKAQHDIDLDDLKGRVHYVLPLPNGWDNLQHQQVRRAAALGGLIETERSPELILITDGEAVVHYCAHKSDFTFPVSSMTNQCWRLVNTHDTLGSRGRSPRVFRFVILASSNFIPFRSYNRSSNY